MFDKDKVDHVALLGEMDMEQLRAFKLKTVNSAAQEAIYAGVTIRLNGEDYSFSYEAEDQSNIGEIQLAILSAAIGIPTDFDFSKGIPYHANGKFCSPWKPEDFAIITTALSKNKLYHTTYCNYLRGHIKSITDYAELEAVGYGVELPPELAANMADLLGV